MTDDFDPNTAFEEAARKHAVALDDLAAKRSIELGAPVQVGLDGVSDWLRSDYPAGTCLLLYDEIDDGRLRTWLLSDVGHVAWETLTETRPVVDETLAGLRVGLGVRAAQRNRAPRLRKMDLKGMASGRRVERREAATIEACSEMLLPGDIARGLEMFECRHLVVVPVGSIGTVPFPLLHMAPGVSLVDRMSVTIAPSLADVGRGSYGTPRRPESALVVGDPEYADPKWFFAKLAGARREAKLVSDLFDVEPLVGGEATKSAVLERTAESPDVVYLATHGVSDPEQPLDEGFLALAPSDEGDSRWTAREVQHHRLTSMLAVLSACQTGLGQAHDAGIIGLARAFQLAGCEQVLMSLWNVDDASAVTLMRDTMTAWLDGLSVPEALRQAMLTGRTQGLTPAQWAAFTILAGPFRH